MLTKVEMVELVEEAFADSDAVYYEAAVLRAVRENALEIDRYGHGHQGRVRYGLCSDEYVLITRPDIDSVPCDEQHGGMTAVAIKEDGHILNLYELQWAIKADFKEGDSYADACDWEHPDVVTVINDIWDEDESVDESLSIDSDGNIMTDSVYNATMISAYLNNLAIEFKQEFSDDEYKLLMNASKVVWKARNLLG